MPSPAWRCVCGGGRRHRRGLPAALRTPIPRTRTGRRASRGSRPRRLRLVTRAPRVPRVRALQHDRCERLRHAAHGALSRRARGARSHGRRLASCSRTAARSRRPRASRAAVQTMLSGRRRAPSARAPWPRRRDSRASSASTWAARRPTSALDRRGHRRHDGVDGRRLSGAPADHRHSHGRRRRRLDRLRRRRRRAAGRPASAGPIPGRSATARGTELTVTDANLLLGRLDPHYFLGGRMRLDAGRARRIADGRPRRRGRPRCARARRRHRARRQRQHGARHPRRLGRARLRPARFHAVAFGGAGGMHACEIADTLDIATVLVPRHPGVLSALGMLLADVTKDYSLTRAPAGGCGDARPRLRERFAPLVARSGAPTSRREGFTGAVARHRTFARRPLHRPVVRDHACRSAPVSRGEFDRRHARLYGYANPSRAGRGRSTCASRRLASTGEAGAAALRPRAPLDRGDAGAHAVACLVRPTRPRDTGVRSLRATLRPDADAARTCHHRRCAGHRGRPAADYRLPCRRLRQSSSRRTASRRGR